MLARKSTLPSGALGINHPPNETLRAAARTCYAFFFLAAFLAGGGGLRLTTKSCFPSGDMVAKTLARSGS